MQTPYNYIADRCKPVSKALRDGKIDLIALSRNNYPGVALKRFQLPKLCTIGIWDIKESQNWGLDWHRNEGLEITYLISGNLQFHTENTSKKLNSGDITLTSPWQVHKLGSPNLSANKLFWIILDLNALKPNQKWEWPDWICLQDSDLKDFQRYVSSTKANIWKSDKQIEDIVFQIEKFIKYYKPQDSLSILYVKINELILQTLYIIKTRPAKKKINPTKYTIELFLKEISDNVEMLRRKWTIEEMALHCGTNQTSFFNFCKKITNKTPSTYLNFLRIEYAMNLIRKNPELSMTEISEMCGFDTSQYFCTVFKHFIKRTPLEFKKSILLR